MIAEQLSMEKEVVRVWFCNRRQKEKRINCPVTTPIKSPIYNSRLVSAGNQAATRPWGEGQEWCLEDSILAKMAVRSCKRHTINR